MKQPGATRRILTHLLGLLLACLLACFRISAQSRFDSWTIDNGLPQNTVRSIVQTRDGYLWFTTLNGLVRYDGVRFTVFDKSNTPGIKSNRFTTLFEDAEGSLWIETEQDGLTRYANGIFTAYPGSVMELYHQIAPTQGNKQLGFWVLNDEVLAPWQNKTLTPAHAQSRSTRPTALPLDLRARAQNSGAAYANDHGLHVFRDGQWITYTTKDGLSSSKINSLYRDGRGNLWVGTDDAGLNRLRDGQFTVYRQQDGLPSDHIAISAACEDRQGNLWFAFAGTGLYRLKNAQLALYTAADGLSGSHIQAIYEDREGSIWIGTGDGGLHRWREEIVHAYAKRDGLLANNAYPILEDRAGGVWVGTWPGLNRYQGRSFIHYPDANGVPFDTVTALYEDRDGGLWVGTYGAGVQRWKDNRFTPLKGLTGYDANGVLAIAQDRAGTLWFGTTQGLFKYEGGALRLLTTADGLPHNQVIVILEDREGGLWLGTRAGLARLKDNTFSVYTEQEGLSSNHVRSLYQDGTGVLWIGTYDGGLNRFQAGRFTRYTMRDGLFDNGVFQILDDGRGNLWMSSNRGIHRTSRQQLQDFADGKLHALTSVGYGRADGMLNAECNGGSHPAGVRTRDGRLWFPTQQGVAVIDPAAARPNTLPPPVLIEEFTVDNQKVAFGGGVRIQPGQERFDVRYTGLSFIKPEQVKFRYKLEGLDEDWVDAGAQRTVNYSYVPPGSYTFRVMAANSDGVWNTEGASVQIVVQPHFWRTWWFFCLAIAGIGGLAVLAYRRRVAQLERARQTQEEFSRRLLDSQEQERQRIAAELHDGLGQSLLIIKNRARMALGATTDQEATEEQLNEISASTAQAIEEVREIAHNLRPYRLDRFGLTKTLQAILAQAARVCAIRFTAEIEPLDNLLSKQAETNLYRVVQEAINNIIKHSGAAQASLRARVEGTSVLVKIEDDGRGFVPNKEITTGQSAGGFGLIGMAERVRILGGTYTIDSAPGRGTVINIKLPITRK